MIPFISVMFAITCLLVASIWMIKNRFSTKYRGLILILASLFYFIFIYLAAKYFQEALM